MTTMFVHARTGSWAPHKETPSMKTKTGIPLYTLAQAMAKGYVPPTKKPPTQFQKGLSLTVEIENKPVLIQNFIQIGKVTFQNGTSEPLGFSQAPSQTLKTYRKRNSSTYIARRLTLNDKDKWAIVTYENKTGFFGLPLRKKDSNKEGYYTRKDLADHKKAVRGELFEHYMGDIQDSLVALSSGKIKTEIHNNTKEVQKAPKHAPWMQSWFNRRIQLTQKNQELYAFYQTWKENRFLGDETTFNILQEWALQDSHLVKIEEAHRLKWINRRNDQYKKLAYRIVMQAKDGGTITVHRPKLKEKGTKATKATLSTEEKASNYRKFEASAARSTFLLFLKTCANREGVTYVEHEIENFQPVTTDASGLVMNQS